MDMRLTLLAVRVFGGVTWKQWLMNYTGEVPHCLHHAD
jgi:hypothetical protein